MFYPSRPVRLLTIAVIVTLSFAKFAKGITIETLMVPSPHLRDISGRIKIGPGFSGKLSAPIITIKNMPVGVYIDDSTPNRDYWVKQAIKVFPHGLVLVGIGMGEDTHYPYPVTNTKQWYPYHSGYSPASWGPIPKYESYTIQWNFPGFTGRGRPTWLQRLQLLRQVKKKHPKLILLY